MQLLTFNEVLTSLCDEFDSLISPKTIYRSNTNVVYLMLKAIAKGFEVINNICVIVSNKFNPENCSDEDLNSVAELVGTEKFKGSASGLVIDITNSQEIRVLLYTGLYHYDLDGDTTFTFEVLENTYIEGYDTIKLFAFSDKVGAYLVTAQSSIDVYSENFIDSALVFSNEDNSNLLGTEEETNLEFRKRILTGIDRQDSIIELQTAIKNEPYIFDARVKFNNSLTEVTVDGVTIPSYHMAIFYSGAPRNALAKLVCSKSVFPTVPYTEGTAEENSVTVYYESDIFTEGKYAVHVIPFRRTNYSIFVNFSFNETYATKLSVENAIKSLLITSLNSNVHVDYIKETAIYTVLENLNINGVEILNVDILDSEGTAQPYIAVPISRIPYVTDVTFPV